MSVKEECGVFGVFSPHPTDVSGICYYGLYALQHRGQESCGIVVNDDGLFISHKDIGLVSEVLTKDVFSSFPKGTMAVGHVRYGTTGATNRANCQPVEVRHKKGYLALAHNGNISNAGRLRDNLEINGAIFHSTSDTEIIAHIITRQRLVCSSIEQAVSNAMNIIDGSYSLIIMSQQKLICARDPYGFRPLCYGKTDSGIYVIASESCALTAVGAHFIADVQPGEIIVFSKEGIEHRTQQCNSKPKSICTFEYIYFARPDSVIDGISVQGSRVKAGRILADKHPINADIVIGTPDSGLDAALGYSLQSGIPYGIGLIKNKYIGRTFIAPGQDTRIDRVKIKLNAISETIKDRRVILVDDSTVRGTTIRRTVGILRDAGAKEVHVRIAAPPFLYPCYYGTDIDSQENLIACHHTTDRIAELIGADTLGYLPLESLDEITGGHGCCTACFSGAYPTPIPVAGKNQFEQRLSEVRTEE